MLKTCLDQLKRAEKLEDKKLVEFWQKRILTKYPDYKQETKSKKK